MSKVNPKHPFLHSFGHSADGDDRLPGAKILIGSDEGDSTELVSSTTETTMKTMCLPPNNFRLIEAEAEVINRFEQDLTGRAVFSWYLKLNGTGLKTFTQRLMGMATAGADSGDRIINHVSTIFPGYQNAYGNVYLRASMDRSNAKIGVTAMMMRLWGIV